MHKRAWIVAVVMMAGLVWSAPAAGQDATSRGSGAYAGLSAERYVDRLRDMGMLELAEAYVADLAEQGWEPRRVRRLLADLEVDKARLTDDEARKAHHLTKAAELYRGVIEELGPKNYVQLTEKYEVQFKLLSTIVDLHARIYVERLKVLRGSQADIDELLALIDEPIYDLEDLVADVKDALDRINAAGAVPMSEFVIVSPRLESLLREADYTLAWAYLHSARASSPTDETGTSDRMMMLRDAIDLVRQFAEDDASSVQWQSALLMGISLREQGLYDEAFAKLSALGGNSRADEMTRVEAMFEVSRALAEQGKLAEAITKAKVYFDESLKLLGDDEGARNWLSLNAAMLLYHANMQAAELADSDDQRLTHQQAAQQELIDFVKEFISVKLSIYAVLAEMYRDRTDYENIPSVFLLAKGTTDEREGTDEGDQQAEEALNVLLERSDPISTQLHAETRAVLARRPGEVAPEEAVRLLELAGGDMSHEQALWWVYSAVDIYDKLITQQYEAGGEASITADQRQTFIDAIRLLLSREDWLKAEPALAVYYFDLGWHTAQLAGETDDPDEELALYNQAIADYESMPATFDERDNTYRYMYSRTMALELRAFLLLRDMQAARSDEGQQTARALRTMLRDYADQARRTIDGMGESDQRSDMIRWGSQADLRAAELTNDPLDNAPAATQELSQLPGKWPEAQDMLQQSAEREIRILIDRGLISQAIDKLNEFLEAHPDEGEALITLVVAEIRSNITSLRYDPQRQQALLEMQENYFKLAGELFAQVADLPIADRYLQTQIYAESHVEVNRPEEARALFQECKDYRQEVGEKLLAELKREYTRTKDDLARVELITEDVAKQRDALKELKDAFLAALETEGIVLASTVESLNAAWAQAADVGDKSAREQGEDLADVMRYLRQGHRRFYERGAPIDPVNDYGLARCRSALGHHEEAAKIYAELLPGIDRNTHPNLYWSIQLERVRSSLAAYQDNRDRLGDLQGLIKKLRVGSIPVFGGPPYRAGFEQLEKQVDDLLQTSDSAE